MFRFWFKDDFQISLKWYRSVFAQVAVQCTNNPLLHAPKNQQSNFCVLFWNQTLKQKFACKVSYHLGHNHNPCRAISGKPQSNYAAELQLKLSFKEICHLVESTVSIHAYVKLIWFVTKNAVAASPYYNIFPLAPPLTKSCRLPPPRTDVRCFPHRKRAGRRRDNDIILRVFRSFHWKGRRSSWLEPSLDAD